MATKRQEIEFGCNCIDEVNRELERSGSNTHLVIPNRMRSSESGDWVRLPPAVEIATAKSDGKSRNRKATVIATYCPFCGKRYEPLEA